ncbi:hypothetical protein GO755_01270 [Spirosoma sp. HMF4905]|uniref:TonB-dependent receptor plug domain-containing protein n=1 Tax=Spirosoma arboris TaxID=2682092 RepID=A0A7K1S489_9BACT|nr:carboxypeptidase-like regulatory domain-containing protein [Spirosoma arboris]MVM28643.1 hypothetical protein [Spirosoma arboris]
MKHFILAIFFTAAFTGLYAQTGKISGRVIDAITLKPLPFTNVYVNNSTMGVTTNDAGEFTLQNVPIGSTEVVFSFIGYIPQQVNVAVNGSTNSPLSIRLSPDTQQVSEVSVKASRDKTWEKQVKRFEKVFLGNTSTCKILNPWVIDFTDENGVMAAKASLPIEIDNRLLGYKLFFQLKKCSYSATQFSIVGTVRFTELEPSVASEAINWLKNREKAYFGSAKHLMKAILDGNSSQQGFSLYRDKVKGKPRSTNFGLELEYNLIPYETATLITPGSGPNEYRIAIKDRMEVHYTNGFTTASFYKDISNPVSWLDVRGGAVRVNKDGTILNPTDVAISGNMIDGRVSGMLPLDYKTGSTVATQAPINFSARRLQEKVYVHTDKPYYYPGDKLWFSAYMNYRIPGLRDTLSKVLYVDLISADKAITQQRILPIDSGRAAGSFRLPATIQPGKYLLRAYTQWMRNYGIGQFFYKPIAILALNERIGDTASTPVSDSLLTITVDKPVYKKRSPVTLTLRFDTTGLTDALKGSFSVSVLDESSITPVLEQNTIKTEFNDFERDQEALTRFNYPIETGITITGIYKDKKGKGKKTALTLVPENLGHIYQASTLGNGEFSVSNLAFYDSTKFVVQPAEGSVSLSRKEPPSLPDKLPDLSLHIVSSNTLHRLAPADSVNAKMLQEVKVLGKKTVQYENSYAQPDVYLKGENLESYASVADAIAAKLPSFKLIYDQTNWFLIWARASVPTSRDLTGSSNPGSHTPSYGGGADKAGSSNLSSHEPNLYINNVLVVGETAGDRLMQLSPTLIDHIEVNGMITSNQGASGSAGLINVFTKRPAEASSKPLSFIKVRGFDRTSPFQSPNYERFPANASTSDYRSTLYWNPRITLPSGHTPVGLSFFTSDQSGMYRVIIEGVTSKGNPIHTEARLRVVE